jgi:hypothetical protein
VGKRLAFPAKLGVCGRQELVRIVHRERMIEVNIDKPVAWLSEQDADVPRIILEPLPDRIPIWSLQLPTVTIRSLESRSDRRPATIKIRESGRSLRWNQIRVWSIIHPLVLQAGDAFLPGCCVAGFSCIAVNPSRSPMALCHSVEHVPFAVMLSSGMKGLLP